jgi:hypothetical protein
MHNCYVYILVSIILCSVENIQAQTSDNDKSKSEFFLNASTGISAPGLSNFNTVVKDAGFLSFTSVYFSRGGGFFTTFPKAKLASIFNFSTYSGSKKDGVNSNWLRSTQVGTSLGVLLKNSDGVQIIPYGGLVYSFFGARVSGNTATSGSVSDYFESPANQHHVTNNEFLINVGLHIAKVGLGKSAVGQKLLFGARAGYHIPLGNGSWKSDNAKLTDGPKINSGGFYATVILGIKQN